MTPPATQTTENFDDLSFGYCTNVHAGITLDQAKENLVRVATQVRQQSAPGGRLPVGLWLAQRAAEQLTSVEAVPQFGEWLHDRGLKAYTFNGFPQGDFHQPVVKHAVYEPTWLEPARRDYTVQLADILAQLLEGSHGSISTLPLGWPHHPWDSDHFRRAAEHLRQVAEHLHRLRDTTGKEIVLAIEPEPGCVIDTARGMVEFLQAYVFDENRPYIRRHIGVCHDICHSAVMFEPQEFALSHYLANGVRIGKVQVSSAVEVPWQSYTHSADALQSTAQQLYEFSEPRYLHQTTRPAALPTGQTPESSTAASGLTESGSPELAVDMVDDLPQALSAWLPAQADAAWPAQPWRIHFHVPIFVERFGHLWATRGDIHRAVQFLSAQREQSIGGAPWFTGDYEVETYAWGVLPTELRGDNLASGIARELLYLQSVLKGVSS